MKDQATKKKDNGLNNLIINIVIPALILMKGAKWATKLDLEISSVQILVLALALPLLYGLYDLIINKEKNFIAVLGFVSILLSGIVGVLKLPTELIAIKEAAIPFIIGCVIYFSNFTSYPIAPKFLYHDDVFDKETINSRLDIEKQNTLKSNIKKASFFLFLSFMLSAFLNFVLAKYFIKSPTGTEAFNDELGQMTLYSYPIIVIPSMLIMVGIIWYIYNSIKKLTGLDSNGIFMFKKEEEKEA